MSRRLGTVEGPNRETVRAEIDSLRANPRNPRIHSEDQINRLAASLRRDGQTKPLLVRRANRMLIAGHGVLQAAQRVGWPDVEVVLLDVSQAAADRIMLGDNRQSDLSEHDEDAVATLLREIEEADWLATGYTPTEVAKLLEKVAEEELEVFTIDTSDRADTFWISVRGPMGDQAQALQALRAAMAELPQVTVELGTTWDLS